MTFAEAMTAIRYGERVNRKGWNGKGMFIFNVPGSTFTVNRAPLLGIFPEGTVVNYGSHIDMYPADGVIRPWVASQADMAADDWCIAPVVPENYRPSAKGAMDV